MTSLDGIAVVTIDSGEKVGAVDDMIFNLSERRLIAFRLGRSGLFGGERHFIDMSDVESIGSDAIMIRDRERVRDVRDNRDYSEMPTLGALTSLRVVTQAGSYVGNVSTVQIDPESGRLSQIDISSGGLMSMFRHALEVPAMEIVSMGTDVVVIPDRFGPRDEEQAADEPEITK